MSMIFFGKKVYENLNLRGFATTNWDIRCYKIAFRRVWVENFLFFASVAEKKGGSKVPRALIF